MSRICILADLRITQRLDNVIYIYRSDGEGMESGEPLEQMGSPGENFRHYKCTNCNAWADGSVDFTMKDHLGKFHEKGNDPFLT